MARIFARGLLANLKKLQPQGFAKSDKIFAPLAALSVIESRSFPSRTYTTSKLPLKKKSKYYLSDSDSDDSNRPNKKLRGTSEFWRRKMQTFHNLLDFNKDGVISYDDFKVFADKFINLGHISEKSAKEFRELVKCTWEAQWGEITPYNLVTLQQYLEDMSHVVNDPDRIKKVDSFLPYLFEAIDRDRSGKITLKEFKLFFECLGHTDEDALFTFRVIDMDCDGTVDKKEFLRYGKDFFLAEDESRISKYFWGPLAE